MYTMNEFARLASLVVIGIVLLLSFIALYGKKSALLWLYGILIVVNDAQFRIRYVMDTSLDYQVLMKIVVWISVFALGFIYVFRYKLLNLFLKTNISLYTWLLFSMVTALYAPKLEFALSSILIIVGVIFITGVILYFYGLEVLFRVLLMALLSGLFLSWFYYFAFPDIGRWNDYGVIRMSGIYSPTHLGMLSVITFFVARLTLRSSVFRLLIMVVALTTCVFTVSRAPLIAFLLTFLFSDIYRSTRKSTYYGVLKIVLSLIISVITVILAANTSIYTLQQFSRSGNPEEVLSLTGRLTLWIWIWDKVKENVLHFLFGYGWGSFRWLSEAQSVWHPTHAHNMLFELLFSQGFVGLALFNILLLRIVRNSWKKPLFLFTVLPILIYSLTSSILGQIPNVLFYILILPIFNFLHRSKRKALCNVRFNDC